MNNVGGNRNLQNCPKFAIHRCCRIVQINLEHSKKIFEKFRLHYIESSVSCYFRVVSWSICSPLYKVIYVFSKFSKLTIISKKIWDIKQRRGIVFGDSVEA